MSARFNRLCSLIDLGGADVAIDFLHLLESNDPDKDKVIDWLHETGRLQEVAADTGILVKLIQEASLRADAGDMHVFDLMFSYVVKKIAEATPDELNSRPFKTLIESCMIHDARKLREVLPHVDANEFVGSLSFAAVLFGVFPATSAENYVDYVDCLKTCVEFGIDLAMPFALPSLMHPKDAIHSFKETILAMNIKEHLIVLKYAINRKTAIVNALQHAGLIHPLAGVVADFCMVDE